MKDKAIKDTMNALEKIILDVYDQGYNEGYTDGYNNGYDDGMNYDKRYESGLNDAWECARKMMLSDEDGGIAFSDILKIFGMTPYSAIKRFSASEAIAKIKEYEEEQKRTCDTCQYKGGTLHNLKKCANCYGNSGWTPKQTEDEEIKVGDEVILDRKCSYVSNVRGVVIACNSCSDRPYKIMLGEGYSKWMKADSIDRKTGRTFPQIEEVLKQMKGKEE